MKKIYTYMGKHPYYNAITHASGGIGVGMLLVYPLFNGHTIRFGLTFLILGLILHVYPLFTNKK